MPLLENNIVLKPLDPTGELTPFLMYKTGLEGQANYIQIECKKVGLVAKHYDQGVGIFFMKDIAEFQRIIDDSFYFTKLEAPVYNQDTTSFWDGRKLICVMFKKTNTAYARENNFSVIKNHVFKKEIPRPRKYRLFDTDRDMKKYLEEELRLVI